MTTGAKNLKTVRVLFLGTEVALVRFVPDLERYGVQLELILEERDLGNDSSYCISDNVNRQVTALTMAGKVDLVLVANNKGVGYDKAVYIVDELKPKTIVFWTTPFRTGMEASYAVLGLKHFCIGRDLESKIVEVFELPKV